MIYVLSDGTKLFAAIGVTYPAGSTLTCTNGTTTLKAKTTTGEWVFAIPKAGTWTVTATNGTDSKSQSVSITKEGQFESVELWYTLMLYKNGEEYSAVTGGWAIVNKSGGGAGAKEANKIYLGYTGSANRRSTAYTQKKVDVSKVSKLYVKANITTVGASIGGLFIGLSNQNTDAEPYENELFISQLHETATGEKLLSLDVSSISGAYFVCLHAHTTKCDITEVYAI